MSSRIDLNSTRTLTLGQPQLDSLLKGGFKTNCLTEIYGKGSSGKSQLVLQLCLTVQLPLELGGLDSEAVFISTEHEFPITRMSQLADNFPVRYPTFNTDIDPMTRIHTLYAPTLAQVLKVIDKLLLPLLETKKIGLIVLDSIAALYRGDDVSNKAETQFLLANLLKKLANKFNLVVIVVNHVTDKINMDQTNENVANNDSLNWTIGTQLLDPNPKTYYPSLGLQWSNHVNCRMLITRIASTEGNHLRALVPTICPWLDPNIIAKFSITEYGIMDY